MPTLAELTGTVLPEQTDGISFLPTLLSKKDQQAHDYLYWEFNERSERVKPRHEYKQAVVFDNWKVVKYIDADKIEVYQLDKDRSESNDVAKEQPEIIEKALRCMEESHQQNPIFPLTKEERNIN